MYYPYLRGKQFELIALRELSEELTSQQKNFIIPIIEPVKSSLNGLHRTIEVISKGNMECFVVINPKIGDFSDNNDALVKYFSTDNLQNSSGISSLDIYPAIILDANTTIDYIKSIKGKINSYEKIAFIHSGFKAAKELKSLFQDEFQHEEITNIFLKKENSGIYRNKFKTENNKRVLIDDFFAQEKRNSDYNESSYFTDLHILYADQNMDGFGDFQTVGKNYSESGGPAYAVAIHLSYMDSANDMEMFVKHYISDTNHTPADPAGKFSEALEKLIEDNRNNPDLFIQTNALNDFIRLHEEKHFPGLGYVKKLSIKHHIETIIYFLQENN